MNVAAFAALEFEQNGPVTTLWLNKPQVRNAFDGEMLKELTSALEMASKEPSVRVVIISGRGPVFCAGADLRWMQQEAKNQQTNLQSSAAIANFFKNMAQFKKPIICAINGAVAGGGMGFVGVADIVIAAAEASFSLSEVKLGLVPAIITPFLLQKVPAGRLRQAMLTGERLGAERARELGLVDFVVEPKELLSQAQSQAELLVAAKPRAQTAAKILLNKIQGMSLDAALDYSVGVLAELRASPEGQKGMDEFLSKK